MELAVAPEGARDYARAFHMVRQQASQAHNQAIEQGFLPSWIVMGPTTPMHRGQYSARLYISREGISERTNCAFTVSTEDEVAAIVPRGLIRFAPHKDDDPHLVCIWL